MLSNTPSSGVALRGEKSEHHLEFSVQYSKYLSRVFGHVAPVTGDALALCQTIQFQFP